MYDHVSKDWLYLRGTASGEIYAYRNSTKEWEEFTVTEPTWEEKYEEWILDPEPYGGLEVLQQIKDAQDRNATSLGLNAWGMNDLTPIAGLKNLAQLDLNFTTSSDLTPLSSFSFSKMLESVAVEILG